MVVSITFVQPTLAQSPAYKALLNKTYEKDFPLVYPEQKGLLREAVVLDTREEKEYAVSHLKTARWVGYETFSMESVSEIPKDETIVVYCSIGARSLEIGKKLKAAGFQNVYNLYGGIFHWVNEENPVFTPDTIQTDQVHTYNKMWGMWLKKGEKVY
ncbi:MAG TPA: rhodanese-like domain-containing protein [Lunatimonas sp.]|nr:rhodanese-like domain-containing protein [Lunatimonas sp.]